jgi:ribulose-5-phosphate 4-epimerase/fuculose-1-phosphate aldolase
VTTAEQSPTDPVAQMLSDLVVANRVLANEGVLDGFGHVSCRHPLDPARYFLPKVCSPETVTVADIIEFNVSGEPVNADGRPIYAEHPIHAALYAARPDVRAICHNHSDAVIPFGLTNEPLRPLIHVAAVIGESVPVWDIADEFGDATDLLVRTHLQGASLSHCLGDAAVTLMRGHGSVVVAESLPQLALRAIYLVRNAALQLASRSLGQVRYLSSGEIATSAAAHGKPFVVDRAWAYWKGRVGFDPA